MEKISVGRDEYVKASSVAKKFGYTTDYLGQLARAKKVKAQLVGRSWYVEPNSLAEHKGTRYRSTAKKTKTEIRKTLEKSQTGANPPTVASGSPSLRGDQNFYRKAYKPIHYEEDQTEMIPRITARDDSKSLKKLTVTPAGAEKLTVEATGEQYSIEATELPEITLKGKLEVVDADPEPQKLEVNSNTRARKVKLSRARIKPKDRFKHRLQLISKSEGGSEVQKTVSIAVQEAQVNERKRAWASSTLVLAALSFALATVLVTGLQGVESRTHVNAEQSANTYVFDLNLIFDSYYRAINKVISFKL